MKKLALILVTFSLLVSACACTVRIGGTSSPGSDEPAGTSSVLSAADTSSSDESSDPVRIPEVDGVYKKMECFDFPGQPSAVYFVSPSVAAVQCIDVDYPEYGYDPGAEPGDHTFSNTVCLVDLCEDAIIKSALLESESETLIGVRENGELVTSDGAVGRINIYDPGISQLRSLQMPEGCLSGTYSRAEDVIYFYGSESMIEMDLEGAIDVSGAFGGGFYYCADYENGVAVATRFAANDVSGKEYTLLDLQGGVIASGVDNNYSYELLDGKLIMSETKYDEETDVFVRDSHVLDASTGGIINDLRLETDGYGVNLYGSFAPGRQLALVYRAENDLQGRVVFESLAAVDIGSGAYGGTGVDLSDVTFVNCKRCEETGLFAAALSCDNGERRYAKLVLVAPDNAVLDRVFDSADPVPQPVVHTLGAGFEDVRARADGIESRFGVTILLGDECLNVAGAGDYELISTEEPEPAFEGRNDRSDMLSALDTLDSALSKYPVGFFDNFRDDRGEGGIRFAIVRELRNTTFENFVAGGIQFGFGSWYNVIINIGIISGEWPDEPTVHHELWHAVELKLESGFAAPFPAEEWNALNPPGFVYEQDFDNYGGDSDKYDYLLWTGGDPYFVQSYSLVNEKEDRATLMEEVFTPYFDDYGTELTFLEFIADKPHIRAKLDYMASRVRETFGSVYWEDYFKN